ncbi:hypothetical protein HYZ78_00070 [Candidatus Microgenomates bacterium]|nr:hypothetical protein [Candidatus Microgenomates bacterium]
MSVINKIKPIFASPLLLLKSLRKTNIDNFLGGLILGAIFALIVNIITVQVQEVIKKQRIYEAVENEILNNLILANNVLKLNNEDVNNKETINYLHTPNRYSKDLWVQSGEPLQYIAQLERETQNKLSVYYSIAVPGSNAMIEKIENVVGEKLIKCFSKSNNLSEVEKKGCGDTYEVLLSFETVSAEHMSKNSYELLLAFHPTRDRLNNFFLRSIMGSESIRPLSGE